MIIKCNVVPLDRVLPWVRHLAPPRFLNFGVRFRGTFCSAPNTQPLCLRLCGLPTVGNLALCPLCLGSGETEFMSWHSPDPITYTKHVGPVFTTLSPFYLSTQSLEYFPISSKTSLLFLLLFFFKVGFDIEGQKGLYSNIFNQQVQYYCNLREE